VEILVFRFEGINGSSKPPKGVLGRGGVKKFLGNFPGKKGHLGGTRGERVDLGSRRGFGVGGTREKSLRGGVIKVGNGNERHTGD